MENIQNFFAPVRTVRVNGGPRGPRPAPAPSPPAFRPAPAPASAPNAPDPEEDAMDIDELSSDYEVHEANPAEAPQPAVNQNPPGPGLRPGAPAGLNLSSGLRCLCFNYSFF